MWFKNSQQTKVQDLMPSQVNSIKHLEKSKYLSFWKCSKKSQILENPNSFYEASITLILKPDKDTSKKRKEKKRKLQDNFPDEYECKNPQQNTSNLNPMIH